ncbi:MAG TPA: AMP-binding protein, partial [Rhodanobacter sp.]|nr:AMP-binding protein [Rhodanobacter sp.]
MTDSSTITPIADTVVGITVLSLFDAQCRRAPGRVAVRCAGRGLLYAELDARANAVAAALIAAGTRRGDRVGVSLPRSEHMLVAVLGVLKTGAAYVPLDPAFPLERLAYMADHARLRQIVSWQRADVPASVAEGREVLELATLPATPP